MKKSIVILVVLLTIYTSNYAQSAGPDKFSIAWEVGIPSNDFMSATSYSGGRIEYQRMIKPNMSVGISGSWNSFSEYVPKTTYQKPDGSGAITTDIVNEVYSVPLTLNVKYYMREGKGNTLIPYVGIGLGGQYSAQAKYFNIYGIEDNNWGFVARPELGVLFSFNRNSALFLSGVYNYAAIKSDFFGNESLDHIAVSLGFVFSN